MESQVEGLNRTLEAVDLGDEHAALVAAARGLAAAVDDDPGKAALWREYREILTALREVAADGDDDGAAELARRLRSSVGISPN